MSDDLSLQKNRVEELIAVNRKEDALQLLYDMIVTEARAGNFDQAEALRDYLMEVDEMALNLIIKAAEAIEAEKTAAIDDGHLERWTGLYSKLTPEETNRLYHSLEEIECRAEEIVCRQGKPQTHLYFIESGSVDLSFHGPEQETPLARIEAGELFGHDTFFLISVNTLTGTAREDAVLKGLPRARLAGLETASPGLVSKLQDYCLRLKQPVSWLKAASLDRRRSQRISGHGKIEIQLVDKERKPVGNVFRADLIDCSRGGISFYVKLPRQETAEKLLHRRFRVRSREEVAPMEGKIDRIGVVRAVISDMDNDYSVHMRFENPD